MKPDETVDRFREIVLSHYRRYGRAFPWRDTRDPYGITVSEFMLQQTGTERVLRKYGPFLERFPGFAALADADLRSVLELWQGLGYNRRALALHRLARTVVHDFAGSLPEDPDVLRTLPGIGPGTAGSIAAFAFDHPAVFIETNIRRVFLHFFFEGEEGVRDRDILPLVDAALDRCNPRDWYYALMDYGVHLKSLHPNANRRSAHYARQARFEDSHRQVRGRVLAVLTACTGNGKDRRGMGKEDLARETGFSPDRVKRAASELAAEGFVAEENGRYLIAEGRI